MSRNQFIVKDEWIIQRLIKQYLHALMYDKDFQNPGMTLRTWPPMTLEELLFCLDSETLKEQLFQDLEIQDYCLDDLYGQDLWFFDLISGKWKSGRPEKTEKVEPKPKRPLGKKRQDPVFVFKRPDGQNDDYAEKRGTEILQNLKSEGLDYIEDKNGNVIPQIIERVDEKSAYIEEFESKFHFERERRERQGTPFPLLIQAIGFMVIEGRTISEMTDGLDSICRGLSSDQKKANKIKKAPSRATVGRMNETLHTELQIKNRYHYNR